MVYRYRGFLISYDPPPLSIRSCDWSFIHVDFDGSPDSGDNRCGTGSSEEDCKRQIDELLEETAD